MDADEFIALINKDNERFREWQKSYKKKTLKDLYKDYGEWKKNADDAREKFWFTKEDIERKDILELMGKLAYFYHVDLFAWNVLEAFAVNLLKEHVALKKSKSAKSAKKRRKSRKSLV